MNDLQIAAALRAGSPDAIAELFDAYGDRLFRYCWSMLRNREIAQVALRDTLLAAQAHIARLADPESLGPWLYSLARAECRRRRAAPAAEADEKPVRPGQRDADSRLMAWNAVMSMEAAEFEALDLACRHDVDLALVLGLPAEEAQAVLDGARQSLERALGAEILVSRGHACPDRAEVLAGCTDTMTAAVRERVLEHASGCAVCGPNLPRNVSAARVFALLPAPTLSPLARVEVLRFIDDHRRPRGRAGELIAVAGAIASVALASAFFLVGSAGQPAAVRAIMPTMAAASPALCAEAVWSRHRRRGPVPGPVRHRTYPDPSAPRCLRGRAFDAAAAGRPVRRPGPGHDHRRHPAAAAGQGLRHAAEHPAESRPARSSPSSQPPPRPRSSRSAGRRGRGARAIRGIRVRRRPPRRRRRPPRRRPPRRRRPRRRPPDRPPPRHPRPRRSANGERPVRPATAPGSRLAGPKLGR